MFESQGSTLTRHKPIVIAAIAVTAMLLYAFPAQNLASASFFEPENEVEFDEQELAQRLVDETEQEIDQEQEQTAEQDQEVEAENEATQSNEATVSQDETNNQANVIETGDNSAPTTQIADTDVIGNALASEAEGGSGGDDERKGKFYEGSSGSGGSGGDSA